jgi:hypothetical protein
LAERLKETDSDEDVVASVEFVLRTALHESAKTDFVHSIAGRIIAEPEGGGKEDAGELVLRSFNSARHWTTASVWKDLEMAPLATSIVRDHVLISGDDAHHPDGGYYLEWYQDVRRKR